MLLRAKPQPAYRYTLSQAYQRWLYEDYAHLWTQQSSATRAEYRAAGSRFHLTGFQYWMKYNLTNLPDILGWWKLDEKAGAIAHDSSRAGNHGTITGASPATGTINGALLFDGINDKIDFGNNPTLDLGDDDFTIELLFQPLQLPAMMWILGRQEAASIYWNIRLGTVNFAIDIRRAPLRDELVCPGLTFTNGNWYHLLFTGDRDGNLSGYLDGIFQASIPMSAWGYLTFNGQLNLGIPDLWAYYNFTADNLIIYRRVLDQATITRHAARRYPA